MFFNVGIAPFDESANGCGRSIKNSDPVTLDNVPETVFGMIGCPLIHHHRCAGR